VTPVRALFAIGGAIAIAGLVACAATIYTYLSEPYALSSTSGLMVFYESPLVNSSDPGQLVQYAPFVFGAGPVVLVAGLATVLAAVALSAALWTGRASR